MYLFGMPGVIFLALTALFGYALLRAMKLPLKGLELAAAAPIVGAVIATWICLIPFLLTGSLDAGIAVAALAMLAAILLIRPAPPAVEKEHLPVVAAIAFISFLFMFFGLFTYFDGEYHAAFPFYGDAAFHAAMMNSFSLGDNFPPSYPMMAGEPLRYTFLIDFFSAALDRLGLGLQWSIVLPGGVLLASLLSLVYFAGVRFTGRCAGGAISVVLLVLSGGIGFFSAIQDWQKSGVGILQFLAHQNLNYTTYYELGLVFTNFTIIVMAQRTALIGFGAGAFAMLLLYALLVQREPGDAGPGNGLAIAGIVTGLLPLFHVYSYICIMLSATLLFLLFRERKWYCFVVPAILLALPQALWIYSQMGTSSFRVQPGWMAGPLLNVPAFWAQNMGVELILLVAGLFVAGRRNLMFYLPFIAIFVMANIFVFQPWDYDNHKFFSFWLMPSVLLMASALLYIVRIPRIGRPLFTVLLVLSVLTGGLAAAFILGHPYVEISKADIHVGDWIAGNTPKDAVFLTSDTPIHPVSTVAGRKSYLGYEGWLYTHGIDTGGRLTDEKQMFGAYDENLTLQLLQVNRIDYVFIGPSELGTTQLYVNQSFYDRHFPCIYEYTDPEFYQTYKIYKV